MFKQMPVNLSVSAVILQYRSSRPEVFCKKGVFRNFAKFTGKHLCQSLFFNQVAGLRHGFCCQFCEISKSCKISKSTFYLKTPLVAASDSTNSFLSNSKLFLSSSKENSKQGVHSKCPRGYTSTFDEFLVSTFFLCLSACVWFIKPSKSELADQIFQHLT